MQTCGTAPIQNKTMAEINIERKKRSGWGWILLLILLALIGWAVYKFFFQDSSRYEQDKSLEKAPVGMLFRQEEPIYRA
jgi:flagellar basal body-associated protein FliL